MRIAVRGNTWRRDGEDSRELREKVMSGAATPEEEELFRRRQEERIHHILEVPEEEFCTVQHINVELPPRARIFPSVTCAFCGKPIAEARARVREGKFACIPCAGEYSRGW